VATDGGLRVASSELLSDAVRNAIAAKGLDLVSDAMAVRALVAELVANSSTDSTEATAALVSEVYAQVAPFGPLQVHLDDPAVEELWINEPGRVFIARDGRSELTTTILSATQVRDLVERMLRATGRRVDLSSPFVDASLPDGSRLHVVIPDITRRHWSVNVRKFVVHARHVDDLVALGTLPPAAANFLRAAVEAGLNIIVAGGTQAGKTTMLNALLGCVPSGERVVTCEETFELQVDLTDWVALQTRQPSLEGTGEVRLRRLVKEALRMRPTRLMGYRSVPEPGRSARGGSWSRDKPNA
jgi:pilus assembly protein CpaF